MPPRSAKKSSGTTYRDETKLRNYDGDVNENLAGKDSASFQAISRLSQVAQLLKRREFWLEQKRRDCARVLTEMVEFIALPFLFSRKLKILLFHVVVEQGRQKKRTKRVMQLTELLFCQLNLLFF